MHPFFAWRAEGGNQDAVLATLSCRSCASLSQGPWEVVETDYGDLEGLEREARAAAGRLTQASCTTCGQRATPVRLDWHTRSSANGRDLVIRVHKRLLSVEVERLWWSPHTGHLAAVIGEKQRQGLRRDAAMRRVRAQVERGGVRSALSLIEEAAHQFRGDPELLLYASGLLAAGRAELLGQIATLHTARHPEDADAWFWLALSILDRVNRRLLPAIMLVQAEGHLRAALAIRPDFPDAEVALCNVARARGDEQATRRCLERALERHPELSVLLRLTGQADRPS